MADEKTEDTTPTDEELAQQLQEARLEGMRRHPLYQSGTLETSDTGGTTDIRDISPAFEDSRRDTVRRAAASLREDREDPNLILPEDEAEAERAKRDIEEQDAKLPSTEDSTDKPDAPTDSNPVAETKSTSEKTSDTKSTDTKSDSNPVAETKSTETKSEPKSTSTRSTRSK